MLTLNIWRTISSIFMKFGYVDPEYPKNHWSNFHEIWMCWHWISEELQVQFLWNLDMLILNIIRTTGLIFIKFGYVDPEYLLNLWFEFHEICICWPWISQEPLVQFSWILDMSTLNILRTLSDFHGIWTCWPWISQDLLVWFSCNLDMLALNLKISRWCFSVSQ